MRVGVQQRLGAEHPAARLQVGDEVLVGVLDPAPGVGADALVVGAVEADRVDDGEAVLEAELRRYPATARFVATKLARGRITDRIAADLAAITVPASLDA